MLVLTGLGGGCGGSNGLRTATAEVAGTATLEVVIPAGTGVRLAAGEPIELLAEQVEFHVGDVLRIVNRDDRTHVVGPFSVQAGETLTQRFTSPGTYRGACSVHPSGSVQIHVVP